MDPSIQQMLAGMGGLGGFGSSKKTLVSFKAGRMNYDGKMVTPDRKAGLLKVVKNLSTFETQFQWCDPDSEHPIEQFYVFPGDAKFEKVKQSKDRVYILQMIGSQNRHFYWMQEDEPEKDAERCKQVHNAINGIEEEKPAATTGAAAGAASASQPPSTPASSASVNPSMDANQQAFMDQLLAMQAMGMGQYGAGAKPKEEDKSPDLQNILTQDAMMKLVKENPDVRKALLEHLPEGQQTDEFLEANLLSSQLQGAMRTLSETINSDQAEIIMMSCGLDSSNMKDSTDGMEALMNGLIKQYSSKDGKEDDKDKK